MSLAPVASANKLPALPWQHSVFIQSSRDCQQGASPFPSGAVVKACYHGACARLLLLLQEAKLKQWQSPQQRQTSTLDSFAATSGYKQMAADAMARVRARLSGWADDETFAAGNLNAGEAAAAPGAGSDSSNSLSPAAGKVLQQLLEECCCREERATVLPEAFLPPGMQVGLAHCQRALLLPWSDPVWVTVSPSGSKPPCQAGGVNWVHLVQDQPSSLLSLPVSLSVISVNSTQCIM